MDNNTLKKKIESLSPWYQSVKFNEEVSCVSDHSRLSGEYAWNHIVKFLPEEMGGMRVLDLGSNAGLFSVRCAQRGASEVIGIEKEKKHFKQSKFLIDYFSQEKELPVRIINSPLESIGSLNLGKFDLVLAISVLYWVGRKRGDKYSKENRNRELKFIDTLCQMTDRVLVRCRNKKYNNESYYKEVFKNRGFVHTQQVDESVYDDGNAHYMIMFERE
jgi:cyclopropane fatty-acyl-phospholipid synthase-like methyltransferase